MSEKIEAALTADGWHDWTRDDWRIRTTIATACDHVAYDLHQDPAKLIALANFALPDDDPRKITRTMVEQLREAASLLELPSWRQEPIAQLLTIADALESYLPPEGE